MELWLPIKSRILESRNAVLAMATALAFFVAIKMLRAKESQPTDYA
jgi:hypothetical protein